MSTFGLEFCILIIGIYLRFVYWCLEFNIVCLMDEAGKINQNYEIRLSRKLQSSSSLDCGCSV